MGLNILSRSIIGGYKSNGQLETVLSGLSKSAVNEQYITTEDVLMSQFFARRAATDQRLLARSCESLLGICKGLLADGHLADSEILFLDTWLKENSDIATTWPGEVIYERVNTVLEDGIVTEEERHHLTVTLSSLIGGTLQESGATGGLSTSLPIDDVEVVDIEGKKFCFTGAFVFGTRAVCEKAVVQLGGEPIKDVRKDLNYLVIGTLASREWAHTSHGRKIEKAKAYQRKGCPILVVSEDIWVGSLA